MTTLTDGKMTMMDSGDWSKLKRDDIIPFYVDLIKSNPSDKDVAVMNLKIILRWSPQALIYIKEKAWKLIETKIK